MCALKFTVKIKLRLKYFNRMVFFLLVLKKPNKKISAMETITYLKSRVNTLLLMMFTMFMSVLTFAQETSAGGGAVTTEQKTTTTTEWYADPMYIIGGAILLIIIIALIARNGRSRA